MRFDEILERFRHRGEFRGGEILITPEDALEAVSLCDQNDVAILGVEAFQLSADGTTPFPDLIADCSPTASLSWRKYCDVANACARTFLMQMPARPSLYVSLTGVDVSNVGSARDHQPSA